MKPPIPERQLTITDKSMNRRFKVRFKDLDIDLKKIVIICEVYMYAHVCAYNYTCVEVRGQLLAISFLIPLCYSGLELRLLGLWGKCFCSPNHLVDLTLNF